MIDSFGRKFLSLNGKHLPSGELIFCDHFKMNISQVSSEVTSSCVTTMLRVVTLGAEEEFKHEATQDKSDRSKGEVDYGKLKQ